MSVRIGDISVTVNGETIVTRPTLRAIDHMNRERDMLSLAQSASMGHISSLMDMIEASFADAKSATIFERLRNSPLAGWHTPAVSRYVNEFVPAALVIDLDNGEMPERDPNRKPVDFEAVIHDLFVKAVGWLGMSPDEAWNSTPGEIIGGVNSHVEKLKLMAGGSKPADEDDEGPDELDRAGLAELASMNSL